MIDDERVDATRNDVCLEGVVLRDVLPKVDVLLRSLIFRDREGKRVSILVPMLLVVDSTERRLLVICEAESLMK